MSYETKDKGGCQATLKTSCRDEAGLGAGATRADQVPLKTVDRKVSLLVAAGSAIATGCEPCLDQIIPNLIEAGVADGDIRRAVEIGQQVKDAAADYMKEVADVLAGTHLARSQGPGRVTDEPTPESNGCCG